MGAAIAIVVRKQHEIVEVFEGARATSPETARDPSSLGIDESRIFHGLVRRAVLRPAGEGRFYLDEPSWNAMHVRRRRLAFVVFGFVALAIVILGVGVAIADGILKSS